ncbi:MAG TPA: DcaP family trimeric outer membrane transporter [Anaeromyxobacter sp.]
MKTRNPWMRARAGLLLAPAALLLGGSPASAGEIKVGGYAKLDVIYSDKIAGGGGNRVPEFAGGAGAVPLRSDADAQHSDTMVNARESRFNVTATGDAEEVKLKGFIEADFVTSEGSAYVSNSRGLRLRHAYGQATFANGAFVLGGQYWSNFQNNEQFYNTIDFGGPAGQLYNRSPQLRVGWKGAGLTATASAEQSAVLTPDGSIPAELAQSPALPVFTGKVHYALSGFTVQGAVAFTQNRATVDRTAAWGAQLGVEVPVPGLGRPVTIQAHVSHLDGVNHLGNGDFGDAAVVGTTVKNIVTTGGYAGLTAEVTKTTAVSGYYGRREASAAVASTAEDKLQESVHVNVVQKLWGGLATGVEYQWAHRTQFDGQSGALNRVQGAMWFYF